MEDVKPQLIIGKCYILVVDVKTTEADVIACCIYSLLAVVIANVHMFTSDEPGPEGSLPFLDILITPDKDGRLETTVYRKPTHTDQYLQWHSHHTISSKYSVIGTLHHRAKTICSNSKLLQQEEKHLAQALSNCK